MGARVLFALLIATPLFNFSSSPSVLNPSVQLAPTPTANADSPRPFRASRLHMTESVSGGRFLFVPGDPRRLTCLLATSPSS
jgi:hypothetical protein